MSEQRQVKSKTWSKADCRHKTIITVEAKMGLVRDSLRSRAPKGSRRSRQWSRVRKKWLGEHGACAVCGNRRKLEVHHKLPFHLHPELELDSTNLVTLCEDKYNGINCHLVIGHLGSFMSYNVNVDADADTWHQKFKTRPGTP